MKETKACGCSGFTLPMAALDAVPVLLFSGSGAVLSELFGGGLFPLEAGCAPPPAGARWAGRRSLPLKAAM